MDKDRFGEGGCYSAPEEEPTSGKALIAIVLFAPVAVALVVAVIVTATWLL